MRRRIVVVILAIAAGYGVYRIGFPETKFADPAAVDVTAPVPGFGGRAAIAVLPFTNLSGDPAQDYFADGIAGDILSGLQTWRTFPVISRNSSFLYQDRAGDVVRELGAGYVVTGSVQKIGDQVRVSAQLSDARTDDLLWGESYERRLSDLFEVQDQIVLNIVNAIAPEVVRSEVSRVIRVRTQNIRAYDYLLQAQARMQAVSFEDHRAARELLLKALELDHRFSPAYVGLAWVEHGLMTAHREKVTPERAGQALGRALDYIKTAIERDPGLSAARSTYGHMLAHAREMELAAGQEQEAVRLNPSDGAAYSELGLTLCALKKYGSSLAATLAAKRLSPRDPGMWWFLTLEGCALMGLERTGEALRAVRRSQELQPNNQFTYIYEVFLLQEAGRGDEAQSRLNALRMRFPGFSLDTVRRLALGVVLPMGDLVGSTSVLDWTLKED